MAMIDLWNKGGFVLCTRGRAELFINGKQYSFTQGEILIITPLVLIRDVVLSDDFTFLSFVDELKVYYDIFNKITVSSIPLLVYCCPIWSISPSEKKYITRQHLRLTKIRDAISHADAEQNSELLKFQMKLLCQEVCVGIINNHICEIPSLQNISGSQVMIVYRFILALHNSYRTQRSVAYYAKMANLSTGHFSKIVKQITGQSPSAWITTVTITYTKFMLEDNGLNIKQIAAQLNFPEQFTFRKYFKQNTGLSPKTYREKHLRK